MIRIKNKAFFSIIVISLTIIIGNNLFAQQIISTRNANGILTNKAYPPGVIVSTIANKDSTLATFIYDPNETVKIIVQFKTPPPAALKTQNKEQTLKNIIPVQLQIENEHSLFKNDLTRIENNGIALPNSILKSGDTKVKYEYKTALNGTAITTKRWVMQEIEKLSYVKAVYEDKEMKALDDTSNSVIGADSVWVKLGLTGKGIKIGIIDTGIDYMHPDLGGGYGPNFKVIGGYDFVNKDNDPMDDHGHGTHVAGIAAANGLLKGVATDAKLYAFKVLSAGGSGDESTIIAGIDRALDPDNDPSTDDAVNIISMSLGGSGDPDDPISQAVDNATAAGIICVIAAGNSGRYQTIGSPGCARTALTVGASDDNDNIASFSSRGPSNTIFAIKPDIVAPGVSINSTKMGGGYIVYSGTSMATPHVAGCAALILQLHPDWTPAMVKAVLMESAKNISKNIWTQGDGRVNILNAFSQSSICVPATISLGIDDYSQSIWTVVDTLKIYNNSSIKQSYVYSNDGNINGVGITFNTLDLTIAPYQSADLIVTFKVDNNIVQFLTTRPPAYTGNILIYSNGQDIIVPYAFIKSPIMQLSFDDNNVWTIDITSRSNRKNYWSYVAPGYSLSALLPQDIYDVLITYFPEVTNADTMSFIEKENINLTDKVFVQVSKQDAKNALTFNMVDEHGKSIMINNLNSSFINSNADYYSGLSIFTNMPITMKTSDMSSDINFEWTGLSFLVPEKVYRVNGFAKGINKNINYINTPNSYRHLKFIFDRPETPLNFNLQEWVYIGTNNTLYNIGAVVSSVDTKYDLASPLIQDGYYMPPPYDNFSYSYLGKGSETLLCTSPLFEMRGTDSLYAYLPFSGQVPVLKTTLTNIPINFGPTHWFGKFADSSSGIVIIPPFNSEYEPIFFCNQTQGYNENIFPGNNITQRDSLKYHLYSNSTLIDSGYINNKYTDTYYKWNLAPGAYCIKIDGLPNNYFNGKKINAAATAYLDTRLTDPNPPMLHSLNIFSDGEYANILDSLKTNKIQFNLDDDIVIKNVLLELQCQNDTNWQNIDLTRNNTLYSAAIPASLKKGYVSLRITGVDNSNNSLTYEVEPAFFYGINHAPSTFSLIQPKNQDTLQLQNPPVPVTFKWNIAKDVDIIDSLNYEFNITGPGVDTSVTGIKDTLLSLDVMSSMKKQSMYIWKASVTDGLLWTASASSFYLYTSDKITGTESNRSEIPAEYSLSQNYPNPFNPVTTINYTIPKPGHVLIKVYNIQGKEVATLVDEEKTAGYYSTKFPINNVSLASGVYFYKIQAGNFISIKKLILLK